MWSALQEFLKLSSEIEATSRTRKTSETPKGIPANFIFSEDNNDETSVPPHAWTRDAERIFISLHACAGIVAAAISTSTITSLPPLFLVCTIYFTGPVKRHLYGFTVACSEIGFLLCVALFAANNRSGRNTVKTKKSNEEINRLRFPALLGLSLEIVGLHGYNLVLLVTDKGGGSSALYLIIVVRFLQGFASYTQLESFLFVSEHFAAQRSLVPVTATDRKAEESIRRNLVTRHDFTFFDVRFWWGPVFGLLFFFFIPAVHYPLSRNSMSFLIFNFYTASSWLFLFLSICATIVLSQQLHWNVKPATERRNSSVEIFSTPLSDHRTLYFEEVKDSNEIEDVYRNSHASTPSELNPAASVISAKPCIARDHYNSIDLPYVERPAPSPRSSSETSHSEILPSAVRPVMTDTSALLLMLISIDFVVEFCAWGLYWNIFPIALQYRILKRQLDMWKIYLPLVIGGITAGLVFDFKRLNRCISRYRCDCMSHDTAVSMFLGLLSFLLCFVLLYCAPAPIIEISDLGPTVSVQKKTRWFFYSSMFLLGTGIAWFIKIGQVVIKELITKQHSNYSLATEIIILPSNTLWLRYFYLHFVGSSLSRLCGSLIAGSLLVFEPIIIDSEYLTGSATLQCGVTTESYLVGNYIISGNEWFQQNGVVCWLTYYDQWLILNIGCMSVASMLFLVLCIVYNFEKIFSEGLASSTADTKGFGKSVKRRSSPWGSWTGVSSPTLNAVTENDVIRCLYHTGGDISTIQYDIRD